MRLYDTARGEVVPFEPGPVVTIYSCGITPYDSAHLGHAQVYLTFDILQRRLSDLGHETRCVRNVTDVDDDILRKARELGVHYLDLAAEEIARFDADMAALGLLPAYVASPGPPRPSPTSSRSSVPCSTSGHAYQSGGAVYFDVSTFAGFGQVSHLSRAEMLVLAAEHGGNPDDPNKRDPLDFVLWQPSAARRAVVGVALGAGPPGLAHRVLGAGPARAGRHHRPPWRRARPRLPPPRVRDRPVRVGHRASRSSATGCTSGWSAWTATKMSKSLGNLVFVGDLLKDVGAHGRPPGPARPSLPHRLGVDGRGHAEPPRRLERVAGRVGRPAATGADGSDRCRARTGAPRSSTTTSTPRAPWPPSTRRPPAVRGRVRALPAVIVRADPLGLAAGVGERRCDARIRTSAPRHRPKASTSGPVTSDFPTGRPRSSPGTTACRWPSRSGAAWPRRRWPRRSTAPRSTSARRCPTGAEVGVDHRRQRGRARRAAPLHRPRAGPGGAAAVARRPLRHRARRSRTASTTTSSCPAGPTSATTTWSASRRRCARSWPRTSPSSARSTRSTRALALFADQPFKREIIEAVGAGADDRVSAEARRHVPAPRRSSTYCATADGFVDLCRGPTCPRPAGWATSSCMRVAGAYWRGDEKRPQLQRIYGTAWESDKALAEHLHRLEEAERRDHRRLGAELDLFSLPRRDRLGTGRVPPQGRHHPPADGGLLPPAPRGGRLRVRLHARTSPRPSCSRPRATSSGSPRPCTRPWSSTAGSSTTSSR